ncbi:hypothetical protein SAMN05216332_11281 [Nitrosospira briensis]|nr:hypothetical protein SAMN05216332_11281 [Nitrosospira briensis]
MERHCAITNIHSPFNLIHPVANSRKGGGRVIQKVLVDHNAILKN